MPAPRNGPRHLRRKSGETGNVRTASHFQSSQVGRRADARGRDGRVRQELAGSEASGCAGQALTRSCLRVSSQLRRVGVQARRTTRCDLRRRPPGRRDLIGMLASSDGTGHGLYRSGKIPVLQLRRWSADVLDEPRAGIEAADGQGRSGHRRCRRPCHRLPRLTMWPPAKSSR
jgi:hypothetical protein